MPSRLASLLTSLAIPAASPTRRSSQTMQVWAPAMVQADLYQHLPPRDERPNALVGVDVAVAAPTAEQMGIDVGKFSP